MTARGSALNVRGRSGSQAQPGAARRSQPRATRTRARAEHARQTKGNLVAIIGLSSVLWENVVLAWLLAERRSPA